MPTFPFHRTCYVYNKSSSQQPASREGIEIYLYNSDGQCSCGVVRMQDQYWIVLRLQLLVRQTWIFENSYHPANQGSEEIELGWCQFQQQALLPISLSFSCD